MSSRPLATPCQARGERAVVSDGMVEKAADELLCFIRARVFSGENESMASNTVAVPPHSLEETNMRMQTRHIIAVHQRTGKTAKSLHSLLQKVTSQTTGQQRVQACLEAWAVSRLCGNTVAWNKHVGNAVETNVFEIAFPLKTAQLRTFIMQAIVAGNEEFFDGYLHPSSTFHSAARKRDVAAGIKATDGLISIINHLQRLSPLVHAFQQAARETGVCTPLYVLLHVFADIPHFGDFEGATRVPGLWSSLVTRDLHDAQLLGSAPPERHLYQAAGWGGVACLEDSLGLERKSLRLDDVNSILCRIRFQIADPLTELFGVQFVEDLWLADVQSCFCEKR